MPTTATPTLLKDAGFLFWAPLLSTVPVNTVAGSVYTDAWPGAWLSLGATEEGSEFSYEINVEAMTVAEFFDPVQYATTERTAKFAFSLANYTLTNLKRALNGGTLTPTGSGATKNTDYVPPVPGAETRCMIGWESLDATMRLVCYQTLSSGTMSSSFKKAPDMALIPCEFNLEVTPAGQTFRFSGAGDARA